MEEEILYVERKKKPGRMQEKYEAVLKFLKTDVGSMRSDLKPYLDNYSLHELLMLVHPSHREYHGKKLLDLGKISETFYYSVIKWN